VEVDAALFRASTINDLAVDYNRGGRSAYRNVDSRRQGFEAGVLLPVAEDWQLTASYTLLDATFTMDFNTCGAPPCTVANIPVPAGTDLPGVARHQGQLRLQWSPGLWTSALEFNAASDVKAGDQPDAVHAPGYGVWNAEIGRNWEAGDAVVRGFARVENLLDHTYVGSVIVNEGNSRFFEAATGRAVTLGVQMRWR
jgi:iron complex outermembrane receptor protein